MKGWKLMSFGHLMMLYLASHQKANIKVTLITFQNSCAFRFSFSSFDSYNPSHSYASYFPSPFNSHPIEYFSKIKVVGMKPKNHYNLSIPKHKHHITCEVHNTDDLLKLEIHR